MATNEQIIEFMKDEDIFNIEIALCCKEQSIDDVILAYYLVTMHNLKINPHERQNNAGGLFTSLSVFNPGLAK